MNIKKAKVGINKLVDFCFRILDLNELVIHDFGFGCIMKSCGGRANLCYVYTVSFIILIKLKIFEVYERYIKS